MGRNVCEARASLEVGGTLAFGGTVILFESYEFLRSTLDLNLTVGIRSDFLLRP